MPRWRDLLARWPHSVLRASEDAVGLPAGQMGNSEVGHLNLGAGRPVLQDLPRIDAAIADGSFFTRPALVAACERAPADRPPARRRADRPGRRPRQRPPPRRARRAGGPPGRAVGPGPRAAGRPRHAAALRARVHAGPRGPARRRAPGRPDRDVGGRYYAMDRDKRWERTERGYDAIVHGEGAHAASATAAIEAAYARGETDEFVVPDGHRRRRRPLRDGDPIVHVNFRADRARQLTHALADAGLRRLRPRGPGRRARARRAARRHDDRVRVGPAGRGRLRARGGALARAGVLRGRAGPVPRRRDREVRPRHVLLQRRREAAWPGEERRLVPSPKVATYDLQPEMSAAGVTEELVVGDRVRAVRLHRGQLRQPGHGRPHGRLGRDGGGARSRSTAASAGSSRRSPRSRPRTRTGPGAVLFVTADHGNADEHARRRRATRSPGTRSTPCRSWRWAGRSPGASLRDGVLADVAPTILELAGLPRWEGMTGPVPARSRA